MSPAIDPVGAYGELLAISREQLLALKQADDERFLLLSTEREARLAGLPLDLSGVGPEAARALRELITELLASDAALRQVIEAQQEGAKRDLATIHGAQHARQAYSEPAAGDTSLFFEGNG